MVLDTKTIKLSLSGQDFKNPRPARHIPQEWSGVKASGRVVPYLLSWFFVQEEVVEDVHYQGILALQGYKEVVVYAAVLHLEILSRGAKVKCNRVWRGDV